MSYGAVFQFYDDVIELKHYITTTGKECGLIYYTKGADLEDVFVL